MLCTAQVTKWHHCGVPLLQPFRSHAPCTHNAPLPRSSALHPFSQVTDGAAAVLMMTRREAVRRGLPILGIFRSFAAVGVDPSIMGVGPAVAIPEAVRMAGLTLDDIDVYEVNEAFASQVWRVWTGGEGWSVGKERGGWAVIQAALLVLGLQVKLVFALGLFCAAAQRSVRAACGNSTSAHSVNS